MGVSWTELEATTTPLNEVWGGNILRPQELSRRADCDRQPVEERMYILLTNLEIV
jgi:hypothetical protein